MKFMNRRMRVKPGIVAALAGLSIALVVFISLAPAREAAAEGIPKPGTHDEAWATEHGTYAKGDVNSCYACHDQSTCTACHDSDNPKEAYHKTDYEYTHYLDKFIDDRECAACHDQQNFCVACHEANAAAGDGRPASHGQPGWAAGGHASDAQYELDTCAACHDASGADPVCMRCHRTGISPHGDNPIIDMESGPWQTDKGYVCFQCHSAADPRLQP